MDSSEGSIIKSLIDYSEYQRLLYIEQEYNKLKSQLHQQRDHEQIGSGAESLPYEFLSVTNKVNSQTNDLDPVIPITLEKEQKFNDHSIPVSSLHYDVQIKKTDENTNFDDKSLIASVPKTKRKHAINLLKEIDKRGNELTFNSSGVIFIDQISIPNSNIFVLFPFLFKKQKCNLPGFLELTQKVHDMGLTSLITHSVKKESNITESNIADNDKATPWWYIGD